MFKLLKSQWPVFMKPPSGKHWTAKNPTVHLYLAKIMRTCQSLLAEHQILTQMHHQDFSLSFIDRSILPIQSDVLVCSPPKNQQHVPWQWWRCINQMQVGWKMCWNWTLRHSGVHDKGRSKRIYKRSKTQPVKHRQWLQWAVFIAFVTQFHFIA